MLIERVSAEERNTWTGAELGASLNEVCDAIGALGRDSISATTQLSQMRIAVIHDPSASNKANVITAQAILDNLKQRAKTLREYKSIIQTLIRGLPG